MATCSLARQLVWQLLHSPGSLFTYYTICTCARQRLPPLGNLYGNMFTRYAICSLAGQLLHSLGNFHARWAGRKGERQMDRFRRGGQEHSIHSRLRSRSCKQGGSPLLHVGQAGGSGLQPVPA
eukprot:365127-Chlamydomonas_euryale.AAC.5